MDMIPSWLVSERQDENVSEKYRSPLLYSDDLYIQSCYIQHMGLALSSAALIGATA